MNGKRDAEKLMGELFAFAEKMLKEYGEFHPFGGYLKKSGEMVHVGVEGGSAKEKVGSLESSFRKLANEDCVRVFGIVTDIALPLDNQSKGDAVKIFLEHRDGYCAEVFFRYQLGDVLKVTDTIAQQGERLIFSPAR
jgi:hypothetical protein